MANIDFLRNLYVQYRDEAIRLVEAGLYLPAFDYVLKCSHTFNILDARKAISVAERNSFMANMRNLSAQIAKKYLEDTEKGETNE
jgi:glycyl-tRNA synthetase alpha chain